MITAHLPSGYVLAKAADWSGATFVAAIVGAVFPDIDLLYMYAIDPATNLHHTYWVHAPAFVFLASIALIVASRRNPIVVAFAAGWMLHVLLDSPTGGMMWAWPFSDKLYYLVRVHTDQSNWILTFLTHWTITFELVIWVAAATLYFTKTGRTA